MQHRLQRFGGRRAGFDELRLPVNATPVHAVQQVAQLAEMLKLSNALPPMGNTLVSNVPGPKTHLYIQGARMEEMHPISTLPPSNLLNITLFSYAGELYFGLFATDELPQLQRLADHIETAFAELEESVRDAHAA